MIDQWIGYLQVFESEIKTTWFTKRPDARFIARVGDAGRVDGLQRLRVVSDNICECDHDFTTSTLCLAAPGRSAATKMRNYPDTVHNRSAIFKGAEMGSCWFVA